MLGYFRFFAVIGVKSTELDWFSSYLENRKITTRIDDIRSNESGISSGVPQGSVLGPLLFILYMSDLPGVISGSSALFADDTLAYDRCTPNPQLSTCCRLQEDLRNIQQWAVEWSTSFNAGKSAVIRFCGKKRAERSSLQPLQLGNAEIPIHEATKHLGVTLTKSLNWSKHIDYILHRVNHKVYILKRLAYKCPNQHFVCRLFVCLVRPILEYAGPVWDSCSKADCIRLERVQVSVARSILRMDRHVVSNADVLETIGWPTLAWRRRRCKLLFFWKLLHGHGPPSLRVCVPPSIDDRAQQNLRRKTFEVPKCRTEKRRQSFIPTCIALWNTLPDSVISCTSSCSFLASLDCFYSPDKYSFGLA